MQNPPELKQHILLYPTEQLFDSLRQMDPPFQRLIEVLHTVDDPPLNKFMQETYVQRTSNEECLLNEHSLADILDTNINNLLMRQFKQKHVQTFGYERKNGRRFIKNLNFNRAVLENSEFSRLLDFFPAGRVAELITNYTVLLLYKGQYVQVTGPSLPDRLNEKLGSNQHYSDKKKADSTWRRVDDSSKKTDGTAPKSQPTEFYLYKRIDRSKILFCNYTGRKAGIHRKSSD